MNRISRWLLCVIAFALVSPAFGEDEPKKGKGKGDKPKSVAAQMMSKLEGIELTPEQKTKLEELATELNASMATLREAGFTPELGKQKADAVKKAREDGKKGKDLEADVIAAMDVSDELKATLKKASEALVKFQKGVANSLTEEQIAKLPEELKAQFNRIKAAGKKEKPAE